MRKFFAVLFTLILVFPLLFATQTLVGVTTWALDREFYTGVFDQPKVYSTLTSGPLFENAIRQQLHLPEEANTSEMEGVLQSLLTPDYMKGQVQFFIDGLFDYLQGKTDEFSPVVDVKPIKKAIAGDKQDEFLTALLAVLPVCQPGQVPGFGSDDVNACKPAGIPDEVIIEQALAPALPIMLSQLPDEIQMEGEIAKLGENLRWRWFIPGMAVPASIFLSVLVLGFISIGIWYLTALIADSTWRVRLQWMGWTLLIPSLFVFLTGFATQSGISAYWINYGLEQASFASTPFGPEFAETLKVVANAGLARIANAFQMVGGICGALSLVFIFWGIATPRKKMEKPE